MKKNVAIKVENLGKKYKIGQIKKHPTLRDVLTSFGNSEKKDEFWALKNVSFEVNQGDVVGIIGKNGSGKSTLLKIISRITDPTEGQVTLKGRVASLLEVGTGFNPELTGRENIYLNGSILGMTRKEINKHFDEIVDFSGVEKFLDTPVKRYSSGMYVRLAFAVAAHLESEILLVDEVLAVGDAEFQKKCLGKMDSLSRSRRTVLFVSHNMNAIRNLCNICLFLENGEVNNFGNTNFAISKYLNSDFKINNVSNIKGIISALPKDPVVKFNEITLKQDNRKVWGRIENGSPLEIEISYSVIKKSCGLRIYFDLVDTDGDIIFRSFHDEKGRIVNLLKGDYISIAKIPSNLLSPKTYEIHIRAGIHNIRSCMSGKPLVIPIDVINTGQYNKNYPGDISRGKLSLAIPWNTTRVG